MTKSVDSNSEYRGSFIPVLYNCLMRFSVPQFIEIEDKIFGPFTFKQFLYLAGGAGLIFLIYNFITPFFFALLFILPVGALSLALAFYKVNDKPFIFVLEAAFRYLTKMKGL